jgi:hypothetical protein
VWWQNGHGLYYSKNFTLIKTWHGVTSNGKWIINDEGAACWDIPGWGPTPCEFYNAKNDILMRYVNKQHSVAGQHLKGNRIGSFK